MVYCICEELLILLERAAHIHQELQGIVLLLNFLAFTDCGHHTLKVFHISEQGSQDLDCAIETNKSKTLYYRTFFFCKNSLSQIVDSIAGVNLLDYVLVLNWDYFLKPYFFKVLFAKGHALQLWQSFKGAQRTFEILFT